MNKITNLMLAFALTTSFIFFSAYRKEKSEHETTLKHLIQLESAYTIDYTKIQPIIKYRDRKIEIIKKIPIYVGNDCQKELQSVKNIIDSF